MNDVDAVQQYVRSYFDGLLHADSYAKIIDHIVRDARTIRKGEARVYQLRETPYPTWKDELLDVLQKETGHDWQVVVLGSAVEVIRVIV